MSFKKLTDLTSSELSIELKKASLVISGHNSDEREAIIRLSTHLIDMGEDPTSYEFIIEDSKKIEAVVEEKKVEMNLMARQNLLAKIVRLERSYFTQDGRSGGG